MKDTVSVTTEVYGTELVTLNASQARQSWGTILLCLCSVPLITPRACHQSHQPQICQHYSCFQSIQALLIVSYYFWESPQFLMHVNVYMSTFSFQISMPLSISLLSCILLIWHLYPPHTLLPSIPCWIMDAVIPWNIPFITNNVPPPPPHHPSLRTYSVSNKLVLCWTHL